MANTRRRKVLKPGSTILNGRYEILKIIHSKGMSSVYLVLDSNLNKQWCLKEIRKSDAGRDNIEYEALLQEANIMKGLNHMCIPRITTIEEEGDSIFIVMDYIDGISLRSYVSKNGELSEELVIKWSSQICQAIQYLHHRKYPIFYRDMKPDNVMIRSNGDISLIDFGISVVIKEQGQLIEKPLGTKGYAAPEQAKKGLPCDLRSDIYAIGKTIYFMLTGINPSQVPKEKLKPLNGVSKGIKRIVDKCTQEDVSKRYQSCEELWYDLQNYQIYDDSFLKSAKRKVGLVFSLFGLSLILLLGSFIPRQIYLSEEKSAYKNLISVAEQSGKPEDYENVLSMSYKHSINIYLQYIESLKVDGVFSVDEEKNLLGYINPNLDILKESNDYGVLSYEIGKLYWFFYEGSSDNEGIISSIKWFKDSQELGYEKELSEVYYQLGVFNRDILSSIAESNDLGMYSEYWNNLLSLKGVDTGELITLQVNLCIARCIDNYMYNLKSDGISKEDVLKEIEDLEFFVSNFSSNNEVSQNKYNMLVNQLNGLQDRVEILYSKNIQTTESEGGAK